MSKYLVHYFMNGTPVGVWDSSGENYYSEDHAEAQAYAEKNLEDANFGDWETLLDVWDGRTPNGRARWGTHESEQDSLEKVLYEVNYQSER